MADVSDVQDALVVAIDSVRVAIGAVWRIARGFPPPNALDAAMKAGQVLVTVFEREGYSRITTRFPDYEIDLPAVPLTLTVAIAAGVVTFGGTCSPDQIAGIRTRTAETSMRCVAGDTPVTMAARFAAAGVGAASGSTLTVAALLAALVERDRATLRPTRQQDVGLVATIWASDPRQRDDAARAIDAGLSDNGMKFLPLSDGSRAWVRSAGSRQTDKAEMASIYRQDLYFTCEFSTTIAALRPVVMFPDVTIKGGW